MKNTSHFFVAILLLSSTAAAQTIQGKLLDENSSESIPYASVGVVGTNQYTLTNENGEFDIRVSSFPVKLRFGHVSYLVNELTIDNGEKLTVRLKPANISLKEVVIGPKNAEKLLVSALKFAQANKAKLTYSKSFYRQFTTINDKPSEIYELFYDLKWNTEGVMGWLATQSRFATAEANPIFTVNNQSFLTFIFSGMLLSDKSGKSIRLSTIKDYKIRIDHYIEKKDQSIAVITCRPKKTSRKKMYVNSTYYIGTNNMHTYRIENELINLPNNFKDVDKFKTTKPSVLTTVSTFKSSGTNIPTLESTATRLNVSFNSDKQPFNINVNSILSVYRIDTSLNKQKFTPLDVTIRDKTVIESMKYDAIFWKNNPIVKRTALQGSFIKMMESKQAFGTMTNP